MSSSLLKDLQGQLKRLEADLVVRSDDEQLGWAKDLRAEYDNARASGRTALSWTEWRQGELSQAAVAWVLGSTFIRFCEDNRLLDGVWLAGSGARFEQGVDSEAAFYQTHPERNARDWLLDAFSALASLPAGRGLLDLRHNPVWRVTPSADAVQALVGFWRKRTADGSLVHDLTDEQWDTRFLGDLYQDLSEFAKKKYALLQTPVFVEEFILDRTLTPAIAEFGLEGLRLIDPACGSGHFLLGAFRRLLQAWQTQAPNLDARVRVQRALDSVHGVDLNPFAVAITRFRLTLEALRASGLATLKDAPAFDYHAAIGDSLLAGFAGHQGVMFDELGELALFEHEYANEDVRDYPHILDRDRYHVVVGNPPYITVKDKALNDAYRRAYPRSCAGKYALSAPFMQRFFELAIAGDPGQPAGYVGQITSNSFMKREFGKKLIEKLLSGNDPLQPLDLTEVIDTSGAYIPGHGTPTVILVGRRQRPVADEVRAVLGVRGEPGQPDDPSRGLVWTQIVAHIDDAGFAGEFVTIADLDRQSLAKHPWSLTGGGTNDLKKAIDVAGADAVRNRIFRIGFFGVMGSDDAFMRPAHVTARFPDGGGYRPLVVGDQVRDYRVSATEPAFFPYNEAHVLQPLEEFPAASRELWPYRTELGNRATFSKGTYFSDGRPWHEWHQLPVDEGAHPWCIVLAFVATHNHFVLDRGGKVFKQSAPVIKLPAGATEDDHLELLGVLNSSTACFWLKQVSHDKGNGGIGGGIADQEWERFFEFTGTKLQDFPLPPGLTPVRAHLIDALARKSADLCPASVLRGAAVSSEVLERARSEWLSLRRQLIAQQEELDYGVYRLYNLADDLTLSVGEPPELELGQRAFEIVLARKVASGEETTAWFDRHGSTPITDLPDAWPDDYKALVERRIELIESDAMIGLLERPEYKRRWAGPTWEELERDALQAYVLDRLEARGLWADEAGPRVLSVAQLADLLRHDDELIAALDLLTGAQDVDVSAELARLVAGEHVPYLAAFRYADSGLAIRAEWEHVWEQQRAEDRGERVDIPVPPKYGQKDFRKVSFWKQRGKLDVPKERFISYPDAGRPGDPSLVLGWAGWHHLAQARALARLLLERQQQDSWGKAELTPLLAGLVELEPWLQQWHNEPDPEIGGSPAAMIEALLDQQLAGYELTRDDLRAFRPPTPTRGRRPRQSTATSSEAVQ